MATGKRENLRFYVRQLGKMLLQQLVLPVVYRLACLLRRGRKKEWIVFADAHHTTMPFSMERMYQKAVSQGCPIRLHLYNYSAEGFLRSLLHSVSFMFLYAGAKCIFICDNFLPVAACKKEEETTVVQLWHSCGLLKKFGYDTDEDVPAFYRGNVYANYDLVTVSAPCCVEPVSRAMKQPGGIVRALGVSRTDVYFDKSWMSDCQSEFLQMMPQMAGKKILLWAPTFRGNAADPYLVGEEALCQLAEELGEEWRVIACLHPHLSRRYECSEIQAYTCPLPTERILPMTDLLITDYSSVLFDYLLLERPFVLFAPDLVDYTEKRGFHTEYETICDEIVVDGRELCAAVKRSWKNRNLECTREKIQELQKRYLGSCKGDTTERIWEALSDRI